MITATFRKSTKFKEVLFEKKYKIKKVIFPSKEKKLKKWLKTECNNNVIAYTVNELEATNTPNQKQYLTSSGTLKRKKGRSKSKKDRHSLLNDYN